MTIETLANVLAWGANLMFIYGAYALAKKRISGWVAQVLANVFYIFQSTVFQNYPLLALSIILGGFGIYGFFSWMKKPLKKPICNYAEHSYLLEVMKHYED